MVQQNTKERIRDVALDLFSKNGFHSVTIGEIASDAGIKAPSLYKHYRNKQEILDAIFMEMQRRYENHTDSINKFMGNADRDWYVYQTVTEQGHVQMVQELLEYAIHDEYSSKFRKMITIEQFRDPAFAQLYTERYVNYIVKYHETLFRKLVEKDLLVNEDTYVMAIQYTSPIIMALQIVDREQEREEEMMRLLERHIRLFNRLYRVNMGS